MLALNEHVGLFISDSNGSPLTSDRWPGAARLMERIKVGKKMGEKEKET